MNEKKKKRGDYALFILLLGGFGGAERRLIRIHNKIAEKKSTDLVIRGVLPDEFKKLAKSGDIPYKNFNRIVCFPYNRQGDIRCLLYLMAGRYKVLHFFDYTHFNWLLCVYYKICKKKTLMTIANYNYILHKDQTLEKWMRRILPQAGWIDLLFDTGYDYVRKLSRRENVSVTPGTYTDLLKFQPASKENLILFAAARLEKSKNADLLIEACSRCADVLRDKGYKAWILGQGYEEEYLKEKIKKYKLDDIVEMKGYMKTSEVTPRARIFTAIEAEENYKGQVTAEAIASGCYILITDVGDSYKMVNDKFATLVKNDPASLSQAVIDVLNMSEEEWQKCKMEARKFAEKNFDISESEGYFSSLLENLG